MFCYQCEEIARKYNELVDLNMKCGEIGVKG